jgi:hypothetical protein
MSKSTTKKLTAGAQNVNWYEPNKAFIPAFMNVVVFWGIICSVVGDCRRYPYLMDFILKKVAKYSFEILIISFEIKTRTPHWVNNTHVFLFLGYHIQASAQTDYSEMFAYFSSVPRTEYWNYTLNQATTASSRILISLLFSNTPTTRWYSVRQIVGK